MADPVCVIKFFNSVAGQQNVRVFAQRIPLTKAFTHAICLSCDSCPGKRQFVIFFDANGLVSTKTVDSCTHTGRTHGILSGNFPAIGAIKFYPETLDFCLNVKAKVAVQVAANAAVAPKAKPGSIPPPMIKATPVVAPVAELAFGGKVMDRFALIDLY